MAYLVITSFESVPKMLTRILLVDNDQAQIVRFAQALLDAGFDVDVADSPRECMDKIQARRFDVACLDLMMPHGTELSTVDTAAGMKTGLALARWIKRTSPGTRLVCLAVFLDDDTSLWFRRFGGGALSKTDTTPGGLVRHIERVVTASGRTRTFNAFIVHGHAAEDMEALRDWLKRTRRCPRPVVLRDEASAGKTIIEKFEHYANDTDVVFVLLTPDDFAATADLAWPRPRARQNVVFELGYFYGRLRRASGTIIVLRKGDVELPSDLYGILTIDITHGIDTALGPLRKELRALLHCSAKG